MGLAMLVARVAILPIKPIPVPGIQDEFSYLLAADTFAHGRVTNPSPAQADFFASGNVLMQPTYASKYPPGQGLFLALGQRLTGDPYWGVALEGALMIALLCWAVSAWLPPQWAILAGAFCLVRFFTDYWFNSYWGGSLAACGGALVVGGLGHFLAGRWRGASVSLAAGAVVLFDTRPYEGAVLCAVTFLIVAIRFIRLPLERKYSAVKTVVLPNLIILLLAVLANGWYNWRITGHVARLPYDEYMRQDATVPFLWVTPPPVVAPSPAASIRRVQEWEEKWYWRFRDQPLLGVLSRKSFAVLKSAIWHEILWAGLLLAALPWVRLRLGKRWLIALLAAGVAALMIEVWEFPHYTAPFTATILILATACGRAVWYRVASLPNRKVIGAFACVVMISGFAFEAWRAEAASIDSSERQKVIGVLSGRGGKHLVFVRYLPGWICCNQWVYNGANFADSTVLFANDLGPARDRELTGYGERRTWLVQLGSKPSGVILELFELH